MYILNKMNGQLIPAQGPPIEAKLMPIVAHSTTKIQGIDPDIVTAASGVATSACSLFQTVNRFHAILDDQKVPHPKNEDHSFSLTESMANTVVMLHQYRKHRGEEEH